MYSFINSQARKQGILFIPEVPPGERTTTQARMISALCNIFTTNTDDNLRVAAIQEKLPGFNPDQDYAGQGVFYIHCPVGTPDNYPTLAAIHRIGRTVQSVPSRSAAPSDSRITTLSYIASLCETMREVGAWSVFNQDVVTAFIGSLFTPNGSRMQTSSNSTYTEYDEANVMQFFAAIVEATRGAATDFVPKRVMLRKSSLLAQAWRCEVVLSVMQNFNWQHLSFASTHALDVICASAKAVYEYTKLRGVRPDQPDHTIPMLGRNEAVQDAFRKYNNRICEALEQDESGNMDHAGPAFVMPDGFKVNVKMAYLIVKKIVRRRQELIDQGNHNSPCDGHFWMNNTASLPILKGNGNSKHIQLLAMLMDASAVVVNFAPVAIKSNMGTGWSIDYGDQHDDVSSNNTIYASIKTCMSCGAMSSGHRGEPNMYTNGDKMPGHETIINADTLKNKHACENCVGSVVFYVIDKNEWVGRQEFSQIETVVNRGPERVAARSFRISKDMGKALVPFYKSCKTCGSAAFNSSDIEKVDEKYRGLMTALSNGVMSDSPLGVACSTSIGRSAERGLTYRMNTRVGIWDSGVEMQVCHRCSNIGALYTDPKTGKLYSNIDSSPSAPDYGYKVPDPEGRWLQRCVGIEFETGPGSSNAKDKDAFLNERCSDGIHVWNIHGDGSLMGGACEITTPPVGGKAIPMAVDAMFALAKKAGFMIENRQAGMHVHTDITDLFEVMLPVRMKYGQGDKEAGKVYAKFANYMGTFGDAVSQISRQFVSSFRRHNQYCSGGFGIRSWSVSGSDPLATYQSKVGNGRQAMCLHMHNGYSKRTKVTYTFENRIWPSSNSKDYTLARTELTQRAVDIFCTLAIAFLKGEEGSEKSIKDWTNALIEVAPFVSMTDSGLYAPAFTVGIPDKVATLLSLSPQAVDALKKLHKRFFWITYYAHERGLSMDSAEIIEMRRQSLAQAGGQGNFSGIGRANEVAGIMLQKQIASTTRVMPLQDPSSLVMMDTIMSSGYCEPFATDESDLVSSALVQVKH
jgi:hypothetical protein